MLVYDENTCCGCNACVSTCPTRAIKVSQHANGAVYPDVDTSVCIKCNRCNMVCPLHLKINNTNKYPKTIACQSKDQRIIGKVSSGGVCDQLGTFVVRQGGVCFGAKFNDDWLPVHSAAFDLEQLKAFRGSKYVQSDTGETFRECLKLLSKGRTVCYIGTPCQIAGLKGFLGKDYDNLYTIDFVCHGVPVPGVWKKYLEYLKEKYGEIHHIEFREKSINWIDYSLKMNFQRITRIEHHNDNMYMKGFLNNRYLRESCYRCRFRRDRMSDLTVADFWGLDSLLPDFDRRKQGTSAVVFHTKKGEELFLQNEHLFKIEQVKFEDFLLRNTAYISSPVKPTNYDKILFPLLEQWKPSSVEPLNEKMTMTYKIMNITSVVYVLFKNAYNPWPYILEYIKAGIRKIGGY